MASIGGAGDLPRPEGPAAQLLIWDAWPAMSEAALAELADEQAAKSEKYNQLGDDLKRDMLYQADLLKGTAGDAHQELMGKMRDHAYAAADHYDTRLTTANGYKAIIHGLKLTLTHIADAAEKEWQASGAGGRGLVAATAMSEIIARYQPEVVAGLDQAWGDFLATPKPSPPPPPPVSDSDTTTQAADYRTRTQGDQDRTVQTVDNRTDGRGTDGDAPMKAPGQSTDTDTPMKAPGAGSISKADPLGSGAEGTDIDAQPDALPLPGGADPAGAPLTGGDVPKTDTTPVMPTGGAGVPVMAPRSGAPSGPGGSGVPASPLGGASLPSGGSLGAPTSAASSLPSSLSGSSLGAPTSASSSLPSSSLPASTPQSLATPLTNAGSSFQSGLASGLGTPGAAPPPMPVQQPAVATPAQPMTAAGGPVVPAQAGPPVDGAAGAGGPPPGGGGGAATVPPAVAGAGPLTPYSPPTGGGGQLPGAAAAGTAAASGGAPGSSAPAGPPQQAGGAGPPLMAGTSGGAVAGALPGRDINPDLLTARRVLDGLVRGTNACADPVALNWAVGVLRTSMGAQTVIASTLGGGGYVPAGVFVPSGVRVAAVDPALPMGWAAMFMGWQSPADIVVAHAEKVAERLAGVTLSALVTTDVYGRRPEGAADFQTMAARDIMSVPGSPPVLDGAHQHRLTTIDPALAQRVSMLLDHGGDVSTELASQLSAAVIRAAQQQTLPTGQTLVNEYDVNTLVAVGNGERVDWQEHFRHVLARDNHAVVMPESQGRPLDLDDSPTSMNIRAFYYGYYRMGRIVELVRCWQHRPVNVLDVAYCGLTAGFGQAVAAVVADWEQRTNTPFSR